MKMTRREAMMWGASAAVAMSLPISAHAAMIEEAIATFTGGADAAEGGVTLDAPEIAENGNTVPVGVAADGAVAIAIFASGNPNAEVATFTFGPLAGSRAASTRICLAQTQDLVAVAQMEDGSFQMATRNVKVTIGGCGG